MFYDVPAEAVSFRRRARQPAISKERLTAALLVIGTIAGGAYYLMRQIQKAPVIPAASMPAGPGVAQTNAAASEAPAPGMPSLDQSDVYARQALGGLSTEPEWSEWLAHPNLIRRFAGAVVAVGEGRSPKSVIEGVRVEGAFDATPHDGEFEMTDASFARYDRVAEVVSRIDPEAVRPAWQLLHPLVERAWREVASPDLTLDQGIARALDRLIETPVPSGAIAVVQEGPIYRFADPALESLTPAQKQLLRMGPANATKVIAALRGLRTLVNG